MNGERENQPDNLSDRKRDELHDRLMDAALGELLSEQTPPDLSERILARARAEGLVAGGAAPTTTGEEEKTMSLPEKPKGLGISWLATAACVLIIGGLVVAVLMPGLQTARESARRPQNRDSLQQYGEPANAQPAKPSQMGNKRYRGVVDGATAGEAAAEPVHYAGSVAVDGRDARELPAADPQIVMPGEPQEGLGPGRAGDRYDHIVENTFRRVAVPGNELSTFSIDVDTASYANVRQYLLQHRMLPPPDAVRIEELINYFDYDYAGPDEEEVPFAAHIEVAACPWTPQHRLVRVALKGREVENERRPLSNLVFLLDVSGSMNHSNKLPLVKKGMKMLAEQLGENDRVSIVVYASAEGLALPPTPGDQTQEILAALERLSAGGSTAGGAGIRLAYDVARANFIPGGTNRVILCTDGDFNVGTTSTADLVRLVEERSKADDPVFLTVLGFGRGNLNDAMMEQISNKGQGTYAYIDGLTEARKVLVEEIGGTLVTIAKDVKIQIEFNPANVAAWRLVGYENRLLAHEDFNDDTKDAGEIGAGHRVTALYEIVPPGVEITTPGVDPLKYQQPQREKPEDFSDELLTLKIRYKLPDGATSHLLEFPVTDTGQKFGQASPEYKFASAVAAFGMLLRDSKYKGTVTYDAVLEIATEGQGRDQHGYRAEFLDLVRTARQASGR
jgi:Ca-activated chloride channel family protein